MNTNKNGGFKTNPILLTILSILLKGETDMTCREKLAIDHPENVSAKYRGGCCGCPSDYKYLLDPDYCGDDGLVGCIKCWDREIPETINSNKNISIKDLQKFINGLDIDGKMISVNFYDDSITVTISKFEKESD